MLALLWLQEEHAGVPLHWVHVFPLGVYPGTHWVHMLGS